MILTSKPGRMEAAPNRVVEDSPGPNPQIGTSDWRAAMQSTENTPANVSEEPPRRFVQAIPSNGDVVHAVLVGENPWMYPSKVGNYLVGRALCGVRGRDAWGSGGMRGTTDQSGILISFDADNIPAPKSGWRGEVINVVCPICVSKVRALFKKSAAVHSDVNGGE